MITRKQMILPNNRAVNVLNHRRLTNAFKVIFKSKNDISSVFLSHKHDEKDILEGVIELLENLDTEVYVDWQDNSLPEHTNAQTAEEIKKRIIGNKKFILLATDAAINSKWCNWELGFGDAKKFENNIALFPISENDGSWKGSEYLQLYPFIGFEYIDGLPKYYVEYNQKRKSLKQWLHEEL